MARKKRSSSIDPPRHQAEDEMLTSTGGSAANPSLEQVLDAVLRLERGERSDGLSQEFGISAGVLESWQQSCRDVCETLTTGVPPSSIRMEQSIAEWTAHVDSIQQTKSQRTFADYFESIAEERLTALDCCQKAEPFRRILLSEGFLPLLIEVAVLQDQRVHSAGEAKFDSVMTSYVDACIPPVPPSQTLLNCWQSAIDDWLNKSTTRAPFDFVPSPLTYKYAYFIHPFPESSSQAGCLNPLPRVTDTLRQFHGKSIDIPATAPWTRTRAYHFASVAPTLTPEVGIQELAEQFLKRVGQGLSETPRTTEHDSAECVTAGSFMMVIPFFRQIKFHAEDFTELIDFGPSPGGCLFAVLLPNGAATSETPRRLRRAAIRCSWLLHQAALAEGDTKAASERTVTEQIKATHEFSRHLLVNAVIRTDYRLERVRRLTNNDDADHRQAFSRVSSSIDNLLCLNECAMGIERRLLKFRSLSLLLSHLRTVYFMGNDSSPEWPSGVPSPSYEATITRHLYMILANLADNAQKIADEDGIVAIGCLRIPDSADTIVWIENTGAQAMPSNCQDFLRGECNEVPRRPDGSEPLGLKTVSQLMREMHLTRAYVSSPFTEEAAIERVADLGLPSVTSLGSRIVGNDFGTRIEIRLAAELAATTQERRS